MTRGIRIQKATSLSARLARYSPTSHDFDGTKLFTKIDGRRAITPMLLVMIAIGTTDLLFALDSIPAVFGLTSEPYIVFAVNAFALMGLRQLYFLLGGLLQRLVYLHRGLAVLLAFIGLKLVLEALDSLGLNVPVPGHLLSLVVIIVVMGVTAVVSVWAVRQGRGPGERRRRSPTTTPSMGRSATSQVSRLGRRTNRKWVE